MPAGVVAPAVCASSGSSAESRRPHLRKPSTSTNHNRQLTRKSTPIVAVASSSGIHCSSEKRKRRLLLPTDALPMSNSLTLTGVAGLVPAVDVSPAAVALTGGIVDVGE